MLNLSRAMLHNPEDYPDPDAFNPDRFLKHDVLDSQVLDPSAVIFGFGRRYATCSHFRFEP